MNEAAYGYAIVGMGGGALILLIAVLWAAFSGKGMIGGPPHKSNDNNLESHGED